jgi:hypothetical protein
VAQLVAHLHGMQGVRGSNPLSSTKSFLLKLLDQLFASGVDSSSLSRLLKLHLVIAKVSMITIIEIEPSVNRYLDRGDYEAANDNDE